VTQRLCGQQLRLLSGSWVGRQSSTSMTCAETNGSGRMTTPRDMRSRFWCSEHAACIRLNELFRTVAFFLDFECRAKNYNCCKRICIDSYYIDANRLSRECVSSQTIQNWQCYSWVQCCSVQTDDISSMSVHSPRSFRRS